MSDFAKETKYTFLPWIRTGLGTRIPNNTQTLRPKVPVELKLKRYDNGGNEHVETVTKDVFLYGPADVEGILKSVIIRTEPKTNGLNFEANYLPHIEFSQSDFPWRYTPTVSDPNSRPRLLPWLCLIVLKEYEFELTSSMTNRNGHSSILPKIILNKIPSECLPDLQQSWAWAHCQITEEVDTLEKLRQIMVVQPYKCTSRIICPRSLESNTKYFAFLVPSFEAGRLAGLGRIEELNEGINNGTIKGTTAAWRRDGHSPSQQILELPIYYQWEFSTADSTSGGGDFEALVRKLKPLDVELSENIGLRKLDVSKPLEITADDDGDNQNDDDDDGNIFGISKPLSLGGVLWSTSAKEKADQTQIDVRNYSIPNDPDSPSPEEIRKFIMSLKEMLDSPERLTWSFVPYTASDKKEDPSISVPIYGKWHAAKKIISKISNDNQDPEWIKNILDNNDLSDSQRQELLKLLDKLRDNSPFLWLEELNLDPKNRVAAGLGTIVIQELQEDLMAAAWDQAGAIVEANRRLRLAKLSRTLSKNVFDKTLKIMNPDTMISTITPFHTRVSISMEGTTTHGETIANILHNSPIPNAFFTPSFRKITSRRGKIHRGLLSEDNHENNLLFSNLLKDFNKNLSNEDPNRPSKRFMTTIESLLPIPEIDSNRFSTEKDFLDDQFLSNNPDFKDLEKTIPNFEETVIEELPNTKTVPLDKIHERLFIDLDPDYTITTKTLFEIHRPERHRENLKDKLDPIMVYPKFNRPMFEPLLNISEELLLPGVEDIPENTVSLLEVNSAFINSYMVGLNHEMSRELLWREYPTDQRGSYFRQFWDPSIAIERERLQRLSSLGLDAQDSLPREDDEKIIEKYRDIDEIHKWKESSISDPKNQNISIEPKAFLIKGELMRRYPNAIIYAIRAVWYKNKPTLPTITQTDPNTGLVKRVFPNLSEEIREPLFKGTMNPDITFFGFSIPEAELLGEIQHDGPEPGNEHVDGTHDKAGWFFVIQEQHSDPRFGIDLGHDDDLPVDPDSLTDWNNLSWNYITLLLPSSNQHIDLENGILKDKEINGIKWGSHSADMANILLQLPVRIAIHISELI